jgi:two-component system chemotaxis response regulator CheY/two-component system response regulator (stage 0 sporulation protein A)
MPNQITAIVVDDDFDTVELFVEYLEIKGIKVLGKGYDGQQAAELYEKLKPDIVFLDIMMPRFDGFHALEKIRQLNSQARIVMVTADLTGETAQKLEKWSGVALVYKPYEFDDIMTVISRMQVA